MSRSPRLLLVLLTLLPTSASGYVRTTTEEGKAMRWASPEIPLIVYVGSPPAGLTSAQVQAAVTASARTWSHPAVPCTGLVLSVTGVEDSNGPATDDRQNRITFRRPTWRREPCDPAVPGDCVSYDPQALAITSVLAVRRTGKIVDADMELNATGDKQWAELGPQATGQRGSAHDLQNTVTHELGHLIGLDHNCIDLATRGVPHDHLGRSLPVCNSAPAEIRAATMFNVSDAGDVAKRDLSPDDALAVCEVYPFGQGVVDLDPAPQGGCNLGSAGVASDAGVGATTVVIGLLGMVLGILLRRRRRG